MVTGNKKPTLKKLSNTVKQYAIYWEDIGIQLSVNTAIIKKDNSQNCKDCFRITLQEWLDATPDATWKTLEDAIYQTVKLDG